nr:MAG TPA: hypothetical protein [Caudoviricetes sp.]
MFPYLRISKIRFITRFALNYHARDYLLLSRGTSASRLHPFRRVPAKMLVLLCRLAAGEGFLVEYEA